MSFTFGEYIVPLETVRDVQEAESRGWRELIHCEECRFYEHKKGICQHIRGMRKPYPSDSCSRGKREDG